MTKVTMKALLQAGVHFGHQTKYWQPMMAPYIYGARNKIHIINLEKTLPLLKDAANFVGKVVADGGKVLFVGTKRHAGSKVREAAIHCGSPYVDHRWFGGTLTNFKTITQSIKKLQDAEQRLNAATQDKLTKKEALVLERSITKGNRNLAGIKEMTRLPEALFVIDVNVERIAVEEANKLKIPVVAVVDTNSRTDGVDYVIPGNDDSRRAIELYLGVMADAVLDAKGTSGVIVADVEESAVVGEQVDEKDTAPDESKVDESGTGESEEKSNL